MKLTSRKILFIISLLCFFVIAPALSLYSMGYRFDFATKAIKKVGMLILESEPKNADVFINDKQATKKTPYKAKGLLPGDYKVKITKEEYSAWEKNLAVKSKKVSWASHIILFFEKPQAENLTTHIVKDFNLSPLEDQIIYFVPTGDDKGIWSLNLKEKKNLKILPANNEMVKLANFKNLTFSNFDFAPDGQKMFFQILPQGQYAVANLTDGKTIFLADFFANKMENVKWARTSDKIYFKNEKNLYQFNLKTKEIAQIIKEDILDYRAVSSEIFYLTNDSKNQFVLLKKLEIKNQKSTTFVSKIPKSNKMSLKISPRKYLAILDNERGELYLFNNEKMEIISKNNIENFNWSKKGNKLLFYNENEIWFYYFLPEANQTLQEYKINTANLLTRTSRIIKNAQFYDEEHIAFVENDTAKISELDSRDKRNTYEIKIKSDEGKIAVSKDKTKLYFIDEDGKNLMEMKITEK